MAVWSWCAPQFDLLIPTSDDLKGLFHNSLSYWVPVVRCMGLFTEWRYFIWGSGQFHDLFFFQCAIYEYFHSIHCRKIQIKLPQRPRWHLKFLVLSIQQSGFTQSLKRLESAWLCSVLSRLETRFVLNKKRLFLYFVLCIYARDYKTPPHAFFCNIIVMCWSAVNKKQTCLHLRSLKNGGLDKNAARTQKLSSFSL